MRALSLLVLLFSLSLASAQIIDLMAGTIDGRDICAITMEEALDTFGRPEGLFLHSVVVLKYHHLGFSLHWYDSQFLNTFAISLSPQYDKAEGVYYLPFSGELRNPAVHDGWRVDRVLENYDGWRYNETGVSTGDIFGYYVRFNHTKELGFIDAVTIHCRPPLD